MAANHEFERASKVSSFSLPFGGGRREGKGWGWEGVGEDVGVSKKSLDLNNLYNIYYPTGGR